MKILIVHGSTVYDYVGGSEVQLNIIAKYLRSCSHVMVFCTTEYMKERPELESFDNFKVYRNNIVDDRYSLPIWQIKFLDKIIRIEKPDIIFARDQRVIYSLYSISKRTNIPFVYQLPCQFETSFFSFNPRNLLNNFLKNRIRIINAFLCSITLKKLSNILTVSKDDAHAIYNKYKIPAQTIYNMHRLPDESCIMKSKHKLRIVWINNFKALKRPEMFMEVAEHFTNNNKLEFVMAGKISDNLFGQSIKEKLEESSNIDYLGFISPEECLKQIYKASVYVLTSTHEGFSNTCIQAWFSKVPVISTIDKDGVIKKNNIGIVVSNTQDLIKAVQTLIDGPEKILEIGRRARIYAIKNHSIDKNGKLYEQYFKKLI